MKYNLSLSRRFNLFRIKSLRGPISSIKLSLLLFIQKHMIIMYNHMIRTISGIKNSRMRISIYRSSLNDSILILGKRRIIHPPLLLILILHSLLVHHQAQKAPPIHQMVRSHNYLHSDHLDHSEEVLPQDLDYHPKIDEVDLRILVSLDPLLHLLRMTQYIYLATFMVVGNMTDCHFTQRHEISECRHSQTTGMRQ